MAFIQPKENPKKNPQKGGAGSESGYNIKVYIGGDVTPTPAQRKTPPKPTKKAKQP